MTRSRRAVVVIVAVLSTFALQPVYAHDLVAVEILDVLTEAAGAVSDESESPAMSQTLTTATRRSPAVRRWTDLTQYQPSVSPAVWCGGTLPRASLSRNLALQFSCWQC